jgi:uncharacterized protein YqeY
MSLEERFQEDLKSAMKGGDQTAVNVLRLLRTRLKEARVAKREDLSDDEVYKVIATEIKKRREAIELFEQGGREDLAAREHKEIGVLEAYMPPKLSEQEIKDLASKAVLDSGAAGSRDLGKVMKVLMPQVVNRADGSEVRKIVKDILTERES